jgi:hypothetical protein
MKARLEHYKIQNTLVSGYHPQTNGLVKRGHVPTVNSLAKYYGGSLQLWPQYLPFIVGKLIIESLQPVDWDAVQSWEDLILARMQLNLIIIELMRCL